MDKRQEECPDASHRRLFIFRHCWILRSKPRETARALRFIILFFDALSLFLSLLSFMSLCRPCHTCQHRPLPVPRCAKRKTVLFLLCMVFTEDLGNCSLAVRTTTASNTGPVDGFVKRAFNETPGDGIPVAPCFCRLFSPLSRPFVVRSGHRSTCDPCSYTSSLYAYKRVKVCQWSRALSCTRYTRDFAKRVLFPVLL